MIGLSEQLFLYTAVQEGVFIISGFKIWPVITTRLLNQLLYHISQGKSIGLKHSIDGDFEGMSAAENAVIPGTFEKVKFKKLWFLIYFLSLNVFGFGLTEFLFYVFGNNLVVLFPGETHIIKTFQKLEENNDSNKAFQV